MEERIMHMLPLLDERQKRLFLASEVLSYGRGGIAKVMICSGVSRNTVKRGIAELEAGALFDLRVRKSGGGPKLTEDKYPNIKEEIRKIIDGLTYGDPMRIISYTTESFRKIEAELAKKGINISYVTVGKVLESMGYSKQSNQKMLQSGMPHPDRNAQFEHINGRAATYIAEGNPVISVDTKKKENIGNFKNDGQEYRAKKNPRKVSDHDFPIERLGKIAPYGIYNVNNNVGFVNVGTSHDTSEFAVESIARWWESVGKHTYPQSRKLYVTADCGGSNGNRVRMWKYQLQQFANGTGLEIEISHYPPGTSKWNKVEHRLFCYITKNWQAKPLVDVQTAINLIGSTTTTTGLKVLCVQDNTEYELAKKVSDADFDAIRIERIEPFGAWNYRIVPQINSQVII